MTDVYSEEKFSRQQFIIPPSSLPPCTVVGVGAIGGEVARQLAHIGVKDLRIIDFDTVELSNTSNQGFRESQIGMTKVAATEKECMEISPSILKVNAICDRFRANMASDIKGAVFSCVDSMSARTLIWDKVGRGADFWCDGRMLGEVLQVFTSTKGDKKAQAVYVNSLFTDEEAVPGRCTSESTYFTAGIAAGLMVHQLSKYVRDIDCDPQLMLNLLAGLIYKGKAT